jgi:ATP phosphoribosyltransferase
MLSPPFVLQLAVPSKGQLHESALSFLEASGLPIRRSGNGREYRGQLGGVFGTGVTFFRADEIPERVDRGNAQLGITGLDLFREQGTSKHRSHMLIPDLGFGRARLVVAVPRAWIDVGTVTDLDEVAVLYRQKHKRGLRMATKFPHLTRDFFASKGIIDYSIVESLGATEGAPTAGSADLIVDLTSSGATLAQNHLKEIADGTVLETQACMIASLDPSRWGERPTAAMQQIVDHIEAHLRAKAMVVLRFVALPAQIQEIRQELLLRYHCEVRDDAGSFVLKDPFGSNQRMGRFTVMCLRDALYSVVAYLRAAGSPEVTVEPCQLVFQGGSRAVDGFRQRLRRHPSGQSEIQGSRGSPEISEATKW